MNKIVLHRHLSRQIDKYLSVNELAKNTHLEAFITAINQTYMNYEKDAELFEQSTLLNEQEYSEVNARLKDELAKKQVFEAHLIELIQQLNGESKPLEGEANLLNLIHILNREIEVKHEYQVQLNQARIDAVNANEAKSEFLSIMSHEIRTPLNAIIGLVYIMEKEDALESYRENIQVLKLSAQNLFLLINDILDFNKIEAGKIELEKTAFDFKNLVQQIMRALHARANENLNSISLEIDDDFVTNVVSDPLRLNQIITNLVSNAIKFTQNGTITIRLSQLDVTAGISTFKVEVIDTGIGIDKTQFTSIFEKFTQAETRTSRQFGGTGLGLVITKRLLHLFDSDIAFESTLGVGTNFYFTLSLPIDTHSKPSSYSDDLQSEVMLNGLNVLLVEDNKINIKIADKIMSHWGVHVTVAENGLMGVEMYEKGKYDIVLMDLSMPVMDGYEATRIIRQTDAEVPIIALTASASFGYLERAMEVGINEYVIKPFNPKELNLKLKKFAKNTR